MSLRIDKSWIFYIIFVFIVGLTYWAQRKQTEPNQVIDTFIPSQHVLIPLEFENAWALKSFSGAFLRADIYSGRKKVLTNTRILRAPKNPDVYAVLLSDEIASQFDINRGPFRLAIRNPKEHSSISGPPDQQTPRKKRARINYGVEK